jgi:quercetin dioxygenase-like cupin family protein
MDYTFIADLTTEAEIPADGTLSRTIHRDDQAKVVLFTFDAGQELSEHRAGRPAIIQVLRGQLTLTLDGNVHEAGEGSFVHMPAGLPHAVRAETPAAMVLTLLGS